MTTLASPGYVDRGLLRLACWATRRLRARGPLPTPLLVAAGLVQIIDGDPYLETTPGLKVRLPGVVDSPPRAADLCRRSPYWTRDPDPPARPSPWFRAP